MQHTVVTLLVFQWVSVFLLIPVGSPAADYLLARFPLSRSRRVDGIPIRFSASDRVLFYYYRNGHTCSKILLLVRLASNVSPCLPSVRQASFGVVGKCKKDQKKRTAIILIKDGMVSSSSYSHFQTDRPRDLLSISLDRVKYGLV